MWWSWPRWGFMLSDGELVQDVLELGLEWGEGSAGGGFAGPDVCQGGLDDLIQLQEGGVVGVLVHGARNGRGVCEHFDARVGVVGERLFGPLGGVVPDRWEAALDGTPAVPFHEVFQQLP